MTTATATQKKTPAAQKVSAAPAKKTMTNYIEAVGRRKTAIARVRIVESAKLSVVINGKPLESYFATAHLRDTVTSPMTYEGAIGKFEVSAHVKGGGTTAQAEAIRLGISRAMLKDDVQLKGELKKLGFLRRDSRKVERKHFGLKKARKASQWKKR